MKRIVFLVLSIMAISTIACSPMPEKKGSPNISSPSSYVAEEGFVDAHGVLIYYKALGKGQPLVVLHGGPGASHDYLLP